MSKRAPTQSIHIAVFFVLTLASTWTHSAAPSKQKHRQEPQESVTSEKARVDAVAPYAKGAFFRLTGLGLFAASAGDLVTTEWGLGRSGVHEANPLAGNRTVRLATHVAASAVVWWTTERMHRAGHPRLAVFIRVGLMVAYSYAALHNVKTVSRG